MNASLLGANLEKADLQGADLTNANLDSVSLTYAIYDSRTIWPEDFNPEAAGALNVSH